MITLILNQGYQPITVISWQRALCMSFLEKVEVLAHYTWHVRTISQSFPAPAVARLLDHPRLRPQVVRFSRRNVYLRDQHRCQYCGLGFTASELTLDHVVPKVLGGKTGWSNVVAACKMCNIRKGGRTPEQAGFRLRSVPVRPQWTPMHMTHWLPKQIPEAWRNWLYQS